MPVPRSILLTHLDYTAWATGKLLEACSALNSEELQRDLRCSHGGILGTLRHIYYAELLWLARLEEPTSMFQRPVPEPALEELAREWPLLWGRFRQWLEGVSDSQLETELHSRRLNGEEFHLERWKVLLHVVNHSTLHRGQVVSQLRQLGATPPATDLFFYYLSLQA